MSRTHRIYPTRFNLSQVQEYESYRDTRALITRTDCITQLTDKNNDYCNIPFVLKVECTVKKIKLSPKLASLSSLFQNAFPREKKIKHNAFAMFTLA